jgi:hypothetical protein
MKNMIKSIAIVFAAGSISLHASGEKVHLKLVFEAVDAKGNRDTVEYAIREKATIGIDKELGEVNIYGQAPKGDLDMRIVRRIGDKKSGIWLSGDDIISIISGFEENLDLKKDYRRNDQPMIFDSYKTFGIKVFAKYYPVNISIINAYNHNSLSEFFSSAGLWMNTYSEISEDTICRELDNSNLNKAGLAYSFLKDSAMSSKKIVGEDTVYSFITEPILLNYWGKRNYTFNDSTSRSYILGFKYLPDGDESVEELKNTIKPYPNPSKNFVMINEGNEGDTFEILNYSGDKVATFAVEEFPYKHDISKLPAGIYYLINTKSGKDFGKFVKE